MRKLKAVSQLDALKAKAEDLALEIHALGHCRPPHWAELVEQFKAVCRKIDELQDRQQAS